MSHTATKAFKLQRISALLLVPLSLWFVNAVITLTGARYEAVTLWFSRPLNAVLMGIFVTIALYHGYLGLHEVLEDYMHKKGHKRFQLILWKLVCLLAAIASITALITIYNKG